MPPYRASARPPSSCQRLATDVAGASRSLGRFTLRRWLLSEEKNHLPSLSAFAGLDPPPVWEGVFADSWGSAVKPLGNWKGVGPGPEVAWRLANKKPTSGVEVGRLSVRLLSALAGFPTSCDACAIQIKLITLL